MALYQRTGLGCVLSDTQKDRDWLNLGVYGLCVQRLAKLIVWGDYGQGNFKNVCSNFDMVNICFLKHKLFSSATILIDGS